MSLELLTPSEFPAFPYDPPYAIQVDLMRHLYASIEQKAVTIIESPTGTGKTLSLLCAALTWLTDEKDRAKKGKMKAVAGDSDSNDAAKDWVIQQTLERVRRELEADEEAYEERLAQARKREETIRRMARARVHKKQKTVPDKSKDTSTDDDDDQFLPETDDQPSSSTEGEVYISPALRALMAKLEKPSDRQENEEETTCTKIFYASRTHSQLAQVLPELNRLKLRRPVSVTNHHPEHCLSVQLGKRSCNEDSEEVPLVNIRAVSLGSRKQLCINDELRKKTRDLDEACRELLGEKGEKRCQYLPPIGEEARMLDFRDQILASPKDIEELADAGRMAHICPYFGSRRAIPQAELVTLPYNLLLQKNAREALGIILKDQVVVIDEAHNLIPILLSLSTTQLSFSVLSTSLQQVCTYISKFRTRLSPANMLHLKRLVVFLDALKKCALEWKDSKIGKPPNEKTEVMTVIELTERMGRKASGINLLEIERYLKSSKVARKIAGYSDKQTEKNADPAAQRQIRKGIIPPLHTIEDFMLSLTNTNDDGRVTFSLIGSPGKEEVELKYQLLNPSPNFMEVVDEARAVILAGGTMSPISDVINQLFAHVPSERITSFSCGHIIPEDNLQTLVVSKGPRGGELEFKAEKQKDPIAIAELGQILLNLASIVPSGMIVFFPSYNFLNAAKAIWLKSGMLEKFGTKKKVFFEPEETVDVDKVLREYALAIQTLPTPTSAKKGGALLFAVIGAKLSEGLNFADDLARSVIIVGLPFANLGSPELRERMKYVKRLEEKRGIEKREKGQKDAATELYENMCMNAVNQSIGRAIRHRGDWASLVLLDRRYATSSIRSKLPKWIGSKMLVTEGFGQTVKELGSFYRNKRV
ncbi:helicase C-terminal domain-containing protein [Crucibulum laeve]|uniref:ATP-dependent DNA helicase CHL1 n=1 Tax=Crucibulum laeve TaxID=68775 RepID=A0A5C3M749_9AGAR|nr:helicase C-terminal domain-containing protein [Crucibulum laeve]